MKEELIESLQLIRKDFQDEGGETGMLNEEAITHEQIREWLSGKISELMKSNFHKLLAILYRIDVHENNVKRVFDEYTPNEIPSMLAELMIQRQLQKVRTRIAYRKKQEEKNKS